MRNPMLTARFVWFSLLVYFDVLILGFAGWEITSMVDVGLPVAGAPIFAIFNACAILLFIALACAELVIPNARTAVVYFECGWTGVLSVLSLSAAIDAVINGAPVYCRAQDHAGICMSSTILAAFTCMNSFATLAYFLMFFYLAHSHASVYGAFWQLTVYQAPWFVEPTIPFTQTHRTGSKSSIVRPQPPPKEPWEAPAFRHDDEERDIGDAPLTPPLAPWARDPEAHALPSRRTAPSPVQSTASLRPPWAQRVHTRRGVDPPFAPAPVSTRMSRLVDSLFKGTNSAPPVPPKAAPTFTPRPLALRAASPLPAFADSPLPEGGFVDCFRGSYGYFPETVADEDSPIEQPGRSEWVRALRR